MASSTSAALAKMHPVEAFPCDSVAFLITTLAILCEVASHHHAKALQKMIQELMRAHGEETLEEKAAILLDMPKALEVLTRNLHNTLRTIRLPPFVEPTGQAVHLRALAAEEAPPNPLRHVFCTLFALSGEVQIYVEKSRPWLKQCLLAASVTSGE